VHNGGHWAGDLPPGETSLTSTLLPLLAIRSAAYRRCLVTPVATRTRNRTPGVRGRDVAGSDLAEVDPEMWVHWTRTNNATAVKSNGWRIFSF
jgi:hypothetical protein